MTQQEEKDLENRIIDKLGVDGWLRFRRKIKEDFPLCDGYELGAIYIKRVEELLSQSELNLETYLKTKGYK